MQAVNTVPPRRLSAAKEGAAVWHNSPVETGRKTGFARNNLDKAEFSTILFRIFPGTRKYILSIRVF